MSLLWFDDHTAEPAIRAENSTNVAGQQLLVSCCWSEPQLAHVAGQGKILTERYSLLPVDLRDLTALQSSLQDAGFQPSMPTYILSECVLVYMEPHESTALLRHLGQQLPSAVCVVYEQVMVRRQG